MAYEQANVKANTLCFELSEVGGQRPRRAAIGAANGGGDTLTDHATRFGELGDGVDVRMHVDKPR